MTPETKQELADELNKIDWPFRNSDKSWTTSCRDGLAVVGKFRYHRSDLVVKINEGDPGLSTFDIICGAYIDFGHDRYIEKGIVGRSALIDRLMFHLRNIKADIKKRQVNPIDEIRSKLGSAFVVKAGVSRGFYHVFFHDDNLNAAAPLMDIQTSRSNEKLRIQTYMDIEDDIMLDKLLEVVKYQRLRKMMKEGE